jgi:hypothetical protein
MRRAVFVAAMIAAGLCVNNSSQASLQGLTKIQLSIAELDQDSEACGITKELIREAFMYPVSSSALRVVGVDASPTFFNVQITTLKMPQGCFSNINFSVHEYLSVQPSFFSKYTIADVVYWKKNYITTSGQNWHAKAISDGIESYAKKFLTEWNLENKSR